VQFEQAPRKKRFAVLIHATLPQTWNSTKAKALLRGAACDHRELAVLSLQRRCWAFATHATHELARLDLRPGEWKDEIAEVLSGVAQDMAEGYPARY
jgi:hypothetical protein